MTDVTNFLKKIHYLIRKNHLLLLSFLLPAVILEIAYITRGIFPFGKLDVLQIDLYHQYAPFLSELQDKYRSFSSLLYSWSGGLGTSFLPQFAYYLSSPLNILIVLFPKSMLTEAVLVLILLKTGLSGLFFNIYLKGIHGKRNLITTAFSVLYALSGFVLSYCWNIMWLDAIYLLPLIILGLHRFVRKGSFVLYCITLTLVIVSNFYIAFFVCLFTFLYYPVCFFQYYPFKALRLFFKKTLWFSFFSLLSAGMSAVLLLPTYFSLKLTSAADDAFPNALEHYHDLFDYISRHFVAASPTIREGMPNMYCGIVVLLLIPLYFLSRHIQLKEKLLHLGILSLIVISFNVNILNFIWHGFHYPNQLPFRFSFLYVFLLLSMCYHAFCALYEFRGKQIGVWGGIILILILLSQKLDAAPPTLVSIYTSAVFILLYTASLTHKRLIGNPQYRYVFLFTLILAEAVTGTLLTFGTIGVKEGYTLRDGFSSGKEVKQIREQLSFIASQDSSFYRTEILPPKTTNDPCLYNYRGLSIFSSTFPMEPVKMMEKLGYHSNGINSYKYEGSTLFLDSFFGIKYIIHRNLEANEKIYRKIAATDNLTVFENPYALPLGFQVPEEINDWYAGRANPFESQNTLFKAMGGDGNIFIPLDQKQGFHVNLDINSSSTTYFSFKRPNKDTSSTARIQVVNTTARQVYLYLDTTANKIKSGKVKIKDKELSFNATRSTLVNLGFCEAGILLEVELTFEKDAPESGSFRLYSFGLDLPKFEKGMDLFTDRALNIDRIRDNHIKGSINAPMDGVMVMTLPYDTGWRVKIDGENTPTASIDSGLLSFELPEGFHTIEMTFYPEMFFPGLFMSAVSLLLFILLIMKKPRSLLL